MGAPVECRPGTSVPIVASKCEGGCDPKVGTSSAALVSSSLTTYRIDRTESLAAIHLDGSTVETGIDGLLHVYEPMACSGCDTTVWLDLGLDEVELKGRDVTGARLRVPVPLIARPGPVPGVFQLAPDLGLMNAHFFWGEAFGSDSFLVPPGLIITLDEGRAALTGNVSFSGIDVALNAVFDFESGPPVAVAETVSNVECEGPDGSHVRLDGSASRFSSLHRALWIQNFGSTDPGSPEAILADGLVADVTLPLGAHTLTLLVIDEFGRTDASTVDVSVRDTTPPTFVELHIDPDCLWPPVHRYVVFELGSEITIRAEDACDPAPTTGLRSATSNEPDDGPADGDTTADVMLGEGAVCLRSERSGLGPGRTYSIEVFAEDSNGNTSFQTLEVQVPHDGAASCPPLADAAFVLDSDPVCTQLDR